MSSVLEIRNFINGEFRTSEKFIESFDPSTGKLFARVPDSDEKVVNEAVAAAKKAFKAWSRTDPSQRSKLLHRVADILESRLGEFAELESRDQGKALWLSESVEVPRAVSNFRHFANTVLSDKEMCIMEAEEGVLNYMTREAVGVAAVIVPWNLPLYLLSFKLAPALAYGNTVVAKPSEFTAATAHALCEVFNQAGVPAGVLNVVFGLGGVTGEALVRHVDVPLISFTGSDRAGLHIAQVAGAMGKKISLEMGGKNAAIVFKDAELEKCIPALIRGSFMNTGQVCLSTSRIYIEKSIYSSFVEKFVSAVKKIKVGDPLAKGVWMGPVCSKQHYEKINSYLKIAENEGAAFLTRPDDMQLSQENKQGYFVGPTVLAGLPDSSALMREEVFGPVTCLATFEETGDVIERANDVHYGLCASVWSNDLQKVHHVANKLEVGTVWCNCWLVRNLHMPFGGQKRSGLGREGTDDSKEFYTSKKTVCVKYKTQSDAFF